MRWPLPLSAAWLSSFPGLPMNSCAFSASPRWRSASEVVYLARHSVSVHETAGRWTCLNSAISWLMCRGCPPGAPITSAAGSGAQETPSFKEIALMRKFRFRPVRMALAAAMLMARPPCRPIPRTMRARASVADLAEGLLDAVVNISTSQMSTAGVAPSRVCAPRRVTVPGFL
jgi:hypothetical protein